MKLHIVTVGEPRLAYARLGWQEYTNRLRRYHALRLTHIQDKWAYDSTRIMQAVGKAYLATLVIDGKSYSSPQLARFLDKRALDSHELCFVIGGPEGLPEPVIHQSNAQISLSALTFPHDLAMVVLAEALYRASTIVAGQPYHK